MECASWCVYVEEMSCFVKQNKIEKYQINNLLPKWVRIKLFSVLYL